MDGVQELVGVTVVAATNRPDVIVSASALLFAIYCSNTSRTLRSCVQDGWTEFSMSALRIWKVGRKSSEYALAR